MEDQKTDFITIGQIGSKIRDQKWVLISCIIVALGLAFTYNHFAKSVYNSPAIIAFEQYNNDEMLNLGFTGVQYESNFIANRIRELRTWTFARDVFLALPDSARRLFTLPDPKPAVFDSVRYLSQEIQAGLTVEQGEKNSSALTISFNSENPELARTVTNTAIDVLQKRNLLSRRQEFASLKDFVDKQVGVVEQKLKESENALQDFKNDHHIASLEDEAREILTRITQAEALYNQTLADSKAKQEKLAIIKKKIEEEKENIRDSAPETSNPMIGKLKEELVKLEVESANLQVQGYAADHPRRKQVTTDIERVKKNLVDLTMGVIQDQNLKGMIDPLSSLKNYLEESVSLDIEIQAEKAQQTHLKQTLQSYNQRLKSLSGNDAKLFGLVRDREVNNKIYVNLLEERERARLREASEIGSIRVIERAQTPLVPYKPRKKLNILIALFVSSLMGLAIIFIRDSFNDKLQSEEEVETVLGLPILASIHKINEKMTFVLGGDDNKFHPLVHSFRDSFTFLWNSLQFMEKKKIKLVMITSAGPGEGKSTVAINLAMAAVKLKQKVLLIDGDLRKPKLGKLLNLPDKTTGLSDFDFRPTKIIDVPANGTQASDDCSPPSNSYQLTFLGAGAESKDAGIFWGLPQVKKGLISLMKDFDFVVIDTPPVLGIPDAVSVGSIVDGAILCISAEQADRTLVLRTKKILKQNKINLLGIVRNKVKPLDIYGKYLYSYRKYYKAAN